MADQDRLTQADLVSKLPGQIKKVYDLVSAFKTEHFPEEGEIIVEPINQDLSFVSINLVLPSLDSKSGRAFHNPQARLATLRINISDLTVNITARPQNRFGYLVAQEIPLEEDTSKIGELLEIGMGFRPQK